MNETRPTTDLLLDGFGRIRELVEEVTEGLDDRTATLQVDEGANTPAWLLWHLARVQDDHVAALAGVPQAWDDWADRFDLPLDHRDIGYGHGIEQVRAVRATGPMLSDYHRDVDALTRRYVETLDATELARIVDEDWDPPVTVSMRLVSVLGDAWQHAGQAAFVLGVARRVG